MSPEFKILKLRFSVNIFSLSQTQIRTPKSETPDQNCVGRFSETYIYIYTYRHMSGSLFLWMGHLFEGGSPKSGGVKIWVFLVKSRTKWKSDQISCFLVKKGVKFRFWGGTLKTCPLKVDRIYGKTFCVVFTVGDFFGVVFSSFLVKNHQIWSLFQFLGILDILTRDPSSQKPTPQK